MKKLLIILIAVVVLVLSIYPVSALAINQSVTALNVSCVKGQVSYSGTVASGVKAAAVLLFDRDGNLMMMDTCGVTSGGAFSGTMSANLSLAGTYTIKASDYEGGVFTEKTFSLYSITYHLNGGTNDGANPSVYSPTESVSLLSPTRSGYKFSGWYTESALTTKVTGWSAGETGAKSLYARWRKPSSPEQSEEPETAETAVPTALPVPTASPAQTAGETGEPVTGGNEIQMQTQIDRNTVRAVLDDGSLQDAVERVLQGIGDGRVKPGEAVVELPVVELANGVTHGSIALGMEPVRAMAEGGIAVKAQIGGAVVDLPPEVLSQAAGVDGASSLRLTSGRGESLAGADNGLFMLSSGEQCRPIGLPYSFALEAVLADGSARAMTAFDGKVTIAVKLTEQELASIENAENLRMVYVNTQTGETEVLESNYDAETATLTFHTTHFSAFQMMVTGRNEAKNASGPWWILWVILGAALLAALAIVAVWWKRGTGKSG